MTDFREEIKSKVIEYKIPIKVLVSDLKKLGIKTSVTTLWRIINNHQNKLDYKLYLGLCEVLMIGEGNILNNFRKYDFILDERLRS